MYGLWADLKASTLDNMILPGVCFLLLLFSMAQSLNACPDGMYCPTGADCDINSSLCESATCPVGGNLNLLANWTEDCEEGTSCLATLSS